MEAKISKQNLVSLEKEESRMLKSVRLADSKTLKLGTEDFIAVRSDRRTTDQADFTQLESRSIPTSPRPLRNTAGRGNNCQPKPRTSSNPVVKQTHAVQMLSRSQSLPIPTVSVTSELTELPVTLDTHLQEDAFQMESKQYLSLPGMKVQEFEEEHVGKKNDNLWLGNPSMMTTRVSSSPKLQSNHGSPTLQRCKSLAKLANNPVEVDINNFLQRRKLMTVEAKNGVVDHSGERIQKELQNENLAKQEIEKGIIPKEKDAASNNGTSFLLETPSSPNLPCLQSESNSPALRRRITSPSMHKVPNNATDANSSYPLLDTPSSSNLQSNRNSPSLRRRITSPCINKMASNPFTVHRSPKLKRPDARATTSDTTADQFGDETPNALQKENLKVQASEEEVIAREKETSCINGAPALLKSPSTPKLLSNLTSPVLRRGRSLSCLNKVPSNSNDSENRSIFTAPRSPKLTRSAEANAPAVDPCGNESNTLQEGKADCRRPRMLAKDRSMSMPLPQKSLKEHPTLDRKDSGKEQQEDQDSGQKIGFADIRNHMSISVNQLQPKRFLTVDHGPIQRSKSTEDIKEALRACKKENQPGRHPPKNAKNKRPSESSEPTLLAQGIVSPRVVRRLSARPRSSTVPKLLETTEEKSFANVTAFNFAAQHSAVNKPVKFREITEPLKKSKWFHALSTIVSLSHFQTAMLEIQKQKEQEKALEENKPSVATSFREIKNCRYLRVPDRFQSNK